MKSKKKQNKKRKIDIEKLNPLIVINEPGECLFAIVDFTLPGINHVRRIISKRIKSTGKIFAVMYEGEVGADNLCTSKKKYNGTERRYAGKVLDDSKSNRNIV